MTQGKRRAKMDVLHFLEARTTVVAHLYQPASSIFLGSQHRIREGESNP